MFEKTKIYVIAGCLFAIGMVLYGAYQWGYGVAETEAELAMAELKNEQSLAILNAQEEAKKKYEQRIKNLVADVERLGADNADWLRKQDAFIGATRDLESCMRERGELARLAVEGRKLLDEATVRFKFCANNGS